jgi:hypothetical protein
MRLLLTVFATLILLQHMPTVSVLAGVVTETGSTDTLWLQGELLHAGGGFLVLLVTTILSVFKPQGMTPYGWRKQHEQRKFSQS